jgi:hypothetical protein
MSVDWIHLTQDKDHLQANVNMVMNLWGNFLTQHLSDSQEFCSSKLADEIHLHRSYTDIV